MKKYIFSLLLVSISLSLSVAQNISFTGQGPGVVENGKQFRVTYTLNAQGETLKQGDFSAFNVLGGPNVGSSSSIVYTNGKMTQSLTYTYTYYLQAKAEGKFTITPAVVTVKGKKYTSNALTIEVVKNKQAAAQAKGETSSAASGVKNEDLYMKVLVNKTSVYQGEPITATVKIYSRVNLAGFDRFDTPEFDNFWKEEIKTNNNVQLTRENVNGVPYNTAVLQQFSLIPQNSGKLSINPVEATCVVRKRVQKQRRNRDPFFDSFFDDVFSSYEDVKQKIKSKSIRINVKPLPAGAPASFNGAVGKYSMSVNLTKNEVKADEAITLKMKISGSGNLKLMPNPSLNLPTDFENYDPDVKNNFNVSTNGITGAKKIDYLMIPRYEGEYTIPKVEFTYFDPSQRKYKTLSKGPFDIKVLRGEGGSSTAIMDRPTTSQKDVQVLGKDIRYIKTNDTKFAKASIPWFGSGSFYASYLGSIGIAAFLFLFLSKRKSDQENVVEFKSKNAGKQVQKRLKAAKTFLDQKDSTAFYKELLQATSGYLEDKLKIEKSALNKESIQEILAGRKINQETIDKLSNLLNQCEMAQYASVGGEDEMKKNYDLAVSLMTTLQSELKK